MCNINLIRLVLSRDGVIKSNLTELFYGVRELPLNYTNLLIFSSWEQRGGYTWGYLLVHISESCVVAIC